MIAAPDIRLFGDDFEVCYSQFLKAPVYAWEQWKAPTSEREFFPDLRIPVAHRTDPSDFDEGSHEPCGLIASSRALSSAVPVTRKVAILYAEIDAKIPQISESVVRTYSAAGPVYVSGAKLFQLEDRSAWIPHFIWRSVLAEFVAGTVRAWTFLLKNIASPPHLDDTLVSTAKVEGMTGLCLWQAIRDEQFLKAKKKPTVRWW